MKYCTKCETSKTVGEFYYRALSKDKLQAHCKKCQSDRNKIYKDSDFSKEWQAASSKRHRAKYPDRYKARYAIGNAIKYGRLVRQPCETCGSTHRIEAHHYLGYAKEHHFDVQWLCRTHHNQAHREESQLTEGTHE
jgi:hypothetical protein